MSETTPERISEAVLADVVATAEPPFPEPSPGSWRGMAVRCAREVRRLRGLIGPFDQAVWTRTAAMGRVTRVELDDPTGVIERLLAEAEAIRAERSPASGTGRG